MSHDLCIFRNISIKNQNFLHGQGAHKEDSKK